MPQSTLNNVRTLQIGNESVEVRELKALVLLSILKSIGTESKRLAGPDGQVKLTPQNFTDVIISVEGLLEKVFTEATGRDRTWIEGLATSDALDLLTAIFDLHREVLTKKFAGLGAAWKTIPTQSET